MNDNRINFLDIGVGEPWMATPHHVKEAALEVIRRDRSRYTDSSGMPELREAIATRLAHANGISASADRVVVAAGAKQAIDHVMRCLLLPGDDAVVISPYYFAFPLQIEHAGCRCIIVHSAAENGY